MFFKIAGFPYDGSKKALPTAKLKMCIIKAQSNKSDICHKGSWYTESNIRFSHVQYYTLRFYNFDYQRRNRNNALPNS